MSRLLDARHRDRVDKLTAAGLVPGASVPWRSYTPEEIHEALIRWHVIRGGVGPNAAQAHRAIRNAREGLRRMGALTDTELKRSETLTLFFRKHDVYY